MIRRRKLKKTGGEVRDEGVSLNGGYARWGHEWRRVPAPCEATRCQGGVMSECDVEELGKEG